MWCISQKRGHDNKRIRQSKETIIVTINSTLEWWQRNISTIYCLSFKVRLQFNWLKLLQMQSMFLTQQQTNSNTKTMCDGCYIYNTCTLEIESTTTFFYIVIFTGISEKPSQMTLMWLISIVPFFFLKQLWLVYFYIENQVLNKIQNKKILAVSIKYLVDSERFTGSIF